MPQSNLQLTPHGGATLRSFVGERELHSTAPDEVIGVTERIVKSAKSSDACDGAQVSKLRRPPNMSLSEHSLNRMCLLNVQRPSETQVTPSVPAV